MGVCLTIVCVCVYMYWCTSIVPQMHLSPLECVPRNRMCMCMYVLVVHLNSSPPQMHLIIPQSGKQSVPMGVHLTSPQIDRDDVVCGHRHQYK